MKRFVYTIITVIILSITFIYSCSNNHKEIEAISEIQDVSAETEDLSSDEMYSSPFVSPAIGSESLSQDIADSNTKIIQSNKEVSEYKEKKSPPIANFIASYAASVTNEETKHKLIRTADVKFKVKDVPGATYGIENIVIRNGGHLLHSHIDNSNSTSFETVISKDSATVTHSFYLKADIQFRVHYTKLDSVLRQIEPYALYIDHRTVNAQDVTLQLFAEKLKKNRLDKKQKRISSAIDNRGRKLDDIIDAEHNLDHAAEQADKAILADYEMSDRIEYSTVCISLYQEKIEYKERVLRQKHNTEYEPSFTTKAVDSLQFGLGWLSELFIMILNIWPIIVVGGAGIIIAVRFRNKKRDKG